MGVCCPFPASHPPRQRKIGSVCLGGPAHPVILSGAAYLLYLVVGGLLDQPGCTWPTWPGDRLWPRAKQHLPGFGLHQAPWAPALWQAGDLQRTLMDRPSSWGPMATKDSGMGCLGGDKC